MYCTLLTYIIIIDLYSGGSRGGARGTPPPPPHLFLDQTGAWRAKKKNDMKSGPHPPPHPLSQSLDPALL